MLTEDFSEYWDRLYKKQTDWAFRAYNRLIQTLSEDVQNKLSLKDEVTQSYVVIFGKTQVGKTTLLLDLMGIDPEQMSIVSEVMRGGQEYGKSATATAMEYCGSANELWGVTFRSKTCWYNSDQEMTQALGQIRRKMVSGQLIAETPCVVHIPKRFFGGLDDSAPQVRILDLPGDNPANKQEQKHVHQMAKTYLPFADLILLVGRGDDLSFLKPEVITLPGIEDWQAMPHRFRIVTTYSYTAQSVRDILRREITADEYVLRKRLIREIERFGTMSDAAKNEALYFPLEFGNSWMVVQASDPALHQRMSPIISRLRAELLSQIAKATTPVGRLRNTLNTHQSVRYIQKKKTEEIQDQIQKLAAKKTQIDEDLAIWRRSVEQAQAKLKKIEDVLACQNYNANEVLIKKAAKNPKYTSIRPFPPSPGDKKDDVVTLRALARDYYQILSTLRLEPGTSESSLMTGPYWVQVRKNLPALATHVVRNLLDDEFGAIRSKLSDYWIDTYLSSDNYQKDLRLVHDAGEEAQKKLVKHWVDAWLESLKKVHGDYLSEQHALQNDLEVKIFERDKSCQQQEEIKYEQAALRTELEHVNQRAKEDLERCERFENFLDEEYLSELNDRMDTIHGTSDECDALLQLLSCVELKYQRDEFMELNKQNTL